MTAVLEVRTTLETELSVEELYNIEGIIEADAPPEILNSFTDVKQYYRGRIEDLCRVGVADAAAFLDEHVVGWADRINRPLNMGSIYGCVLGQVFDPVLPENQEGPRRFFGLLPPKNPNRYRSGFVVGADFLLGRGYVDKPFIFSAPESVPFWEAEIARRVR